MKKLLLILILLIAYAQTKAQRGNGVWDGLPDDSTEFSFEITDTLFKDGYRVDTSGAKLWRIGGTLKHFSATSGVFERSIMTDTVQPYPLGANDWFTITGPIASINPIVSFRHKYQSRRGRDGGIVEFSLDSGLTWNNVIGDCEVDSNSGQGIRVTNFYESGDTLFNGTKGFSGASNGWKFSRVQFFWGLPVRTTKTTKGCIPRQRLDIRFRFISDSTTDTLDGWLIDGLKIENDHWGGDVKNVVFNRLPVYPNPSSTGIINFPVLKNEQEYTIEVFDVTGRSILNIPYKHQLDLNNRKGLHYYKVKSPEIVYSGTIQLE